MIAIFLILMNFLARARAHTIPVGFADFDLYVATGMFTTILFAALTYLLQSSFSHIIDNFAIRTTISAFLVYDVAYLLIVGWP